MIICSLAVWLVALRVFSADMINKFVLFISLANISKGISATHIHIETVLWPNRGKSGDRVLNISSNSAEYFLSFGKKWRLILALI